MTTTALVLGCDGFCGVPLVRALRAGGGVRVIGADLRDTPAVEMDEHHRVDVADGPAVAALVKAARPDWIFNLAGVAVGDVERAYRVNLLGAVHVLEAARRESPGSRIVLVGSAAEYGLVPEAANPLTEESSCTPVTPYGLSKHAMTEAGIAYARQHGLGVVVMRAFNIVGPGVPEHLVLGAVLARAKKALAAGGEAVVKIGNLEARRDFVSVEDAVRAYVLAAKSDLAGEVINVCSGRAVSIRDVVERLLSFAPRPVRLEIDPSLYKAADVPLAVGDPGKAELAIGWRADGDVRAGVRSLWTQQ